MRCDECGLGMCTLCQAASTRRVTGGHYSQHAIRYVHPMRSGVSAFRVYNSRLLMPES